MAGCVAAWSAAGGAFGMGEFGNRCAHLCSPGLYNGVRSSIDNSRDSRSPALFFADATLDISCNFALMR
eukprot:CAMPEP_0113582866 /NCGR_PEP_ID=MMETSP0015_2-20120614/32173_1 /TAXON_ID=2838 /ORGANISM="Odontella" /LENGTH=68 /DNA_ID=CAMNT_0000487627 /DNA_START=316 /DNA_END=519 /DNA_ORIENTATION=+ /assembly_acc=CAM_ASM_000160